MVAHSRQRRLSKFENNVLKSILICVIFIETYVKLINQSRRICARNQVRNCLLKPVGRAHAHNKGTSVNVSYLVMLFLHYISKRAPKGCNQPYICLNLETRLCNESWCKWRFTRLQKSSCNSDQYLSHTIECAHTWNLLKTIASIADTSKLVNRTRCKIFAPSSTARGGDGGGGSFVQ